MGSSISIANDTPDPWVCRMGHDEKALEIAMIVVSIVSTVVPMMRAATAALPLTTVLAASGAVRVLGVSTRAMQTIAQGSRSIASTVRVVDKASEFSIDMAEQLTKQLEKDGYHAIEPTKKHTWGKKSLSLWQQGTCVKTTIVDERTVRTETLYMRPIFSGATDHSDRTHSIQWWLDHGGQLDKQDTIGSDEEPETTAPAKDKTDARAERIPRGGGGNRIW